jgi:site-specific recombinase XerC
MMRELRQVKDKTYRGPRARPRGRRFLRYLKVEGKSTNTLRSYETVLRALTLDHADLEITDFQERGGGDLLIDFLDERWGTSSRETLHHRVAVLRSFFGWALRTGRIERDPTTAIRTPKRTRVVRFVPSADLVEQIVSAQPLCDQAGLLCMASRSATRRGSSAWRASPSAATSSAELGSATST